MATGVTNHMDTHDTTDVAIIGAGPSGAAAAAWLARRGLHVRVIERSRFPRFSIGESLLPQCMVHLEACGLLEAARAGDFQPKNGAAFTWRGQDTAIDFRDKFSPGPGTTWQVERADFDQRLIEGARQAGAEVEFDTSVEAFVADADHPSLTLVGPSGERRSLRSRFVLDASGYGRVLARLTGLARPSTLESRCALFTHIEDHIVCPRHDREKILIGLHPDHPGIWYWLIPFRNGRASVGVVGDRATLEATGIDDSERLWHFIHAEPRLAELLANAETTRDVGRLEGYSADVQQLHGPGFALLGNAGEFLDPVFSSGVTIALDSALRAAPLVERQLAGEKIDWETQFEQPLRRGVATFREFVDAWYDGRLPRIIFNAQQTPRIRAMISSVLAGYAWDENNPFVAASRRRLNSLAEACSDEASSIISEVC
ncbi:NAD(P)/FAD-dependent oxidoreductase [Billgrantia tianxiuensis]|uniref:NAD(P)/FAD-dependent oxidoreductase n=2 Tax=Halomonadaceae TaxID=28256 RepID=A0A6I6SN17_9GAMM|nr:MULTISPECIES: NAD(P)/FAD-dependent oxidoreductase [Halomonas]MCE8034129.1 NAD(P)-binding protein [Halomonas sp. MCCC 1A11057]QHC52188.1 NAD(P)/FAD-dependent oxidoreductase [Halomonas tianxiuensis]